MAKIKTTETENSVEDFINAVPDLTKRADSFRLVDIFKKLTGFEPKMWGPSIIGFGSYHYKYESGHEGDMAMTGFSPRKDAIVLYILQQSDIREQLLEKFGKHKTGKACIYIKKLQDIDIEVLEEMITIGVNQVKAEYP